MTLTATTTDYEFSIHGNAVRYATTSSLLADPVTKLLRYFRVDACEGHMPLTIRFHAVSHKDQIPVAIPSKAETLFEKTIPVIAGDTQSSWRCEVLRSGSDLIIKWGDQGFVIVNEETGSADGYLVRPEEMHEDIVATHFHMTLTILLKRRGLYTVHATALEKDGRGILIPGYSGRGKTTTFVSLLRSGYRYLSDDHPLIRDNGTYVEALSFPMKIDVTEPTIQFFPELRNAPEGMLRRSLRKRYFYAEEMYQASVGARCKPAMILFPHVVDSPHSCLEPLPKGRALELLMPQGLLVYDQVVARREFQTLAKMVQQTDCYRLHFGRDVLELPGLITPVLEARN